MSDETIYTKNDAGGASGGAGAAGTAERAGFCQDCGAPLTPETARPVGAGVFCEPCLAARVGSAGAYTTVPPVAAMPQSAGSAPNPVLAGFLGLIPGVGAMYNGQFAKGVAHLVIFVVLMSLADRIDPFVWLVAGWVFYQVFDAYHTAKALAEGRPLPNPFGLNDIGERVGVHSPSGATAPGDAARGGNAPQGYAPPVQAAYTAPSYGQPYTPPATAPDWVGYVPPSNFAGAPAATPYYAPEQVRAQAMRDAGAPPAAYAPTYTGGDAAVGAGTAAMPPARRFPAGALWLIGLGVVFLLFESGQEWGWRLNMNWVMAVALAGLAAFTLARRLHPGVQVVCVLRWPLTLAVLAVLFALQALEIEHLGLGTTWPVLCIVFGAMLIVERTALSTLTYAAPTHPLGGSVVPPVDTAEAERTRAAWAANASVDQVADSAKDGQ